HSSVSRPIQQHVLHCEILKQKLCSLKKRMKTFQPKPISPTRKKYQRAELDNTTKLPFKLEKDSTTGVKKKKKKKLMPNKRAEHFPLWWLLKALIYQVWEHKTKETFGHALIPVSKSEYSNEERTGNSKQNSDKDKDSDVMDQCRTARFEESEDINRSSSSEDNTETSPESE
ncbi:hypothetical protein Q8A73_005102, partial [Channa argus]